MTSYSQVENSVAQNSCDIVALSDERLIALVDELHAMAEAEKKNIEPIQKQPKTTAPKRKRVVRKKSMLVEEGGASSGEEISRKKKRKQSVVCSGVELCGGSDVNDAIRNEWIAKPPKDSPYISWTDANHQYTVQNPANKGSHLVKIHVYRNGVMKNNCAIYLDVIGGGASSKNKKDNRGGKDGQVYTKLLDLLTDLESMWLSKNKDITKREDGGGSLVKIVEPLPAWQME